MEKNVKNLIRQFHIISRKKWIKGAFDYNNIGNVGLTFEKELNKCPDNSFFPDYEGIEIKCISRFSDFPIYLFSTSLEGSSYPEINRLIEKYGYYDLDYSDKLVLFEDFNFKATHIVNGKWIFELDIDKDQNKLFFCVYDLNRNLIEKESYVYLDVLYNHLTTKLTQLAIVRASKKIVDEVKYFRYYELSIYKLISFDKFLELLKNKIINVSIVGRISKSGERQGRYRNKNLEFKIKKKHINLLFKRFYYYNYDSNITEKISI